MLPLGAQPVQSKNQGVDCDALCASLMKAIQESPDTLIMKLEDALVINEACAGDIVTAAISAVGAQPALANQIIQTAIKVAPTRTAAIQRAVTNFQPVASAAQPYEEIRRPALPDGLPAVAMEEVRRAESPLDAQPMLEVRRAEVAAKPEAQTETMEVRRAEMPAGQSFASKPQAPRVSKKRQR